MEALLGIWSPQALEMLQQHVHDGFTDPKLAVEKLRGKIISPASQYALLLADSPEQWSRALHLARQLGSIGSIA
jgi:hypothetical protein